jgi:prepilin-type N-terminal cleavage/methylation domain-containing protein
MRLIGRDERGFTMIEVSIVSALLLAVMGMVFSMLNSGLHVARITEQESSSLDDARTAQHQLLKDIRSAVSADTTTNTPCTSNGAPAGYCLLIYYQSPSSGVVDQIRYRAVQIGGSSGSTTLYRDTGCDPAFSCSNTATLITNLGNRAQGVPMFSCVTTSSYPQIQITLIATPLSRESGSGSLLLQSTGRPRDLKGRQC